MATDFFERQSVARRNTKWLVAMFVLAVVSIVGATFVATAVGAGAWGAEDESLNLAIVASVVSLLLIAGGSAFKIAQMSGGGTVVAERLNGHRVFPNSTDPVEKRLLNVVEEMALASGVPVPPVYILAQENGINAFAAGFSPSDAVVGVTRGCAEQLTREQLQGVVAHEFSHILNGDMRLNLRLIGVLHGILLLGLIGRELLRFGGHSRGSRSNGKGDGIAQLALVGLAFMAIGFLGLLFGNLIKAAVSRQREYLADSSAVQFTRNPEGIAGALKRIGAAVFGSKMENPRADEASHMFFAEGVSHLFSTHPPLAKRIRRLDPQWNGKYPPALPADAVARVTADDAAGLVGAGDLYRKPIPVEVVERAAEHVGNPREIHQRYVQELVAAMPQPVVDAAHDPYGSRAVIYATLLDRHTDIRLAQLRALDQTADPKVYELTRQLIPAVDALDVQARLPLVDMSLPALRSMSLSQYRQFYHCFIALVEADQRLGLFEWTLHQVLLRHLRPQYEPVRPRPTVYYGLQRLGQPCSVLLSALARASQGNDQAAFDAGVRQLPEVPLEFLPPEDCTLGALNAAVVELAQAAPPQREKLVAACAACICADATVKVTEAELLRAVCDLLNCPMPPLLPGQEVSPAMFASRERSRA